MSAYRSSGTVPPHRTDWRNMNVDLTPVLEAGLVIVANSAQYAWRQRGGVRRGRVHADLEIYSMLPIESNSRVALLERIDGDVAQLLAREARKRRDPFGTVLALVLMTAGTVLMAEGVPSNAWWLLG